MKFLEYVKILDFLEVLKSRNAPFTNLQDGFNVFKNFTVH